MRDDDLPVELVVAAARFVRWTSRRAAASPGSMPRALWRALSQLEEMGPVRVSTLAELDQTSQPTATAIVQRLDERGWVARRPDPGDGRAVLVEITGTGREVLTAQRAAAAAALAPAFAALTDVQRDDLGRGVLALEALLRTGHPAGPAGPG